MTKLPRVIDYLSKNFGPEHKNAGAAQLATSVQDGGSAAGTPRNLIVDPDQAQFSAAPDSLGLPKDIQMFIITGDPTQPGPYSLLLKIPANVVIPPHWEATDESIVALRGKFLFGEGDHFDAGRLQDLKLEAVLLIPARVPTFSQAKDPTIILISGVGPVSFGHDNSK